MNTMNPSSQHNKSFVPSQEILSLSSSRHLKDPGSALTHLAGAVLTIIAGFYLVPRAAMQKNPLTLPAVLIFLTSMFLLYLASTLYHSIHASERITLMLKKADHIMIYFLIAGTYTPVCLLALPGLTGQILLGLIWGLAIVGLFLTVVWVHSPKWLNSTIYIAMGWLCVFAFRPLLQTMPPVSFAWLLAGGIVYTIGGIIYALKLPLFNALHPGFGSHEIFHLFVLGGSFCHFISISWISCVHP